ncbi:hypothetical protein B0O99DRAFT_305582 [Bisporella sp. PMI_857]|nr:hypothetical protein B0O99DRAFT_305582 [Bisporella sp. PMI_857]
MPYGTVKWFKDEKGLGIIGQDDGGEDLFVHSNDIDASGWRTLREGQRVSYEVISGQKGKQAAGVRDVGPRRKSFLDKLETGGFAVKTSLTIDGLWLDKMPASPGSDDARKTHNKLPEAVHPMTPNSPYVGVNREPETHETYKGNVLQQLEDSMKASADSLRKCLELEEKIRRPTLEMAPEAKRHALRDYSEQQQEPFEQKGRSQGDFPVSKEKISEQPQSIVFDENSLTPLEQVHLRPGLKGYAFTPSKESSNTVMPGDFESTTYSKSHLPESSPSQPAEANTSHHFGTVNPADEAGYASTQTDSASQLSDDLLSKRIEEAIAAEARAEAANISKMLPHTADSDYEPSEFLGGEGSICSQEESISSKSSIDVLLGPTEEFVTLLIDQTKLPTLYPTFYQAFEFPDFKSQLHHLLKVFSRDLSKEASIPVEKESVRFISQQRRRISHAIGQEVFGLKQQSLFQSNTKQQQPDAKEKIERFFSKIANDEEPISAQEDQNSDNDSSDDEAELSVFPNLDQVRKFLIESKALEKLRINVKNLAEQQNSASIRPDAKSHGELKDREGPKPNELMEGKEIEGIIVPQPGLEKEQSSSNHLRYVEDVAENIELQVWAGSRLISSSGLKETAYRVLARHFRPTVKAGYKRLEWKCDCGTTLYGDFFAHNSIEIDKLGEELGAYGYEGQSKHGNGVKTVPTGQGQSNQPSRGPIAPQRSTGNQTTSTQPTTPAVSESHIRKPLFLDVFLVLNL